MHHHFKITPPKRQPLAAAHTQNRIKKYNAPAKEVKTITNGGGILKSTLSTSVSSLHTKKQTNLSFAQSQVKSKIATTNECRPKWANQSNVAKKPMTPKQNIIQQELNKPA